MRLGDVGQAGTLVDLANALTDNTLTLADYLPLFNACNGEITDAARYAKLAVAQYDPSMGGRVSLPADFYRAERLTLRLEGMDYARELEPVNLDVIAPWTYRKWGNTLLFLPNDKPGTLEIFYFARLPEFTADPNAEPVIPEPFHDIYALYAAWRLAGTGDVMATGSLDATKRDFRADFYSRRDELDAYTYLNENRDPVTIRHTHPAWWG